MKAHVLLISLWCLSNSYWTIASPLEDLLANLNHELHLVGMKYMDEFYQQKINDRDEAKITSSDSDEVDGDHHHKRARRSAAVLDMVKSSRKTGNREELSFRSSIPFKTLSMFFQPEDIVPILIEEHAGNVHDKEKPLLFAVANNKNEQGGYISSVLILSYNDTLEEFSLHQVLPEYAPYELESFSGKVSPEIHRHFLAVSGYADNDPEANSQTLVSIYEIVSHLNFKFQLIQRLQNQNVRALKYVEIAQTTYLLIGSFYQRMATMGTRYSSPSQINILRYEPLSNYFHFHSSLPASGVVDFECFTANKKTYLTVANYCDDYESLDIFSYVYVYREDIRSFELIQYLSTHGARDIEHFLLTNEHYIVVANEGYGKLNNVTKTAPSDVYKLDNGKFELIQKLDTYGAIKWKNIPVPNCKQDVLLVYADQRDNVDQVGIYSFSHNSETFSAVPFSIYHLDQVTSTFRPNPFTLASFYTQDQISGEFNLYVILGVNNTKEGSTIYKLSYDVILADSPFEAFTRNVEDQLGKLNASINEVSDLLNNAENNLYDAVTFAGNDNITGHKIFRTNLDTVNATMNTLNITQGSIFYLRNGTYIRKSPEHGPEIDIFKLQSETLNSTTSINVILTGKSDVMFTDANQTVTGAFQFDNVEANRMNIDGNLTVISDRINGIHIKELSKEIVSKNVDRNLTGRKVFAKDVYVKGNISTGGLVNGIEFPRDLVLNNTDQTIEGKKTFKKAFSARSNLNCNNINSVNMSDLAFINEGTWLSGEITFTENIHAQNISLQGKINNIDLKNTFEDTVYKSRDNARITGQKTFMADVYSHSDVEVNGTVNGFDLNKLKIRVDAMSRDDVLRGEYIFTSDVTILQELNVTGQLNDINFPNNVFLNSGKQELLGNITFDKVLTFLDNVNVEGLIDNVNFSKLVLLTKHQNITGEKTFLQTVAVKNGQVYMAPNKTINNLDLSEFADEIVTLNTDQTLNQVHFENNLQAKNISIQSTYRGKSETYYKDVYETSLHSSGDQIINGNITIKDRVTIFNNVSTSVANNATFPEDFATIDKNQVFTGEVIFVDDLRMSDVAIKDHTINGINISAFDSDVINPTIQRAVFGNKTIEGPVIIKGDLITSNRINSINFDTDLLSRKGHQNISGIKRFDWLTLKSEVTAYKDIGVQFLIDGVDLSELDLSGMTISKNETITGNICFTKPDYNKSVHYINGIDLSELKKDIVTINTEQILEAPKTFLSMVLKKNLNTTSTIDGFDVSEWTRTLLHNEKETFLNGTITFEGDLLVEQNAHFGVINNHNVSKLYQNIISRSGNESIEYLQASSIQTDDVIITHLNEFTFDEDILFTSGKQNVTGHKKIESIEFDQLSLKGLLNKVNISELVNQIIYKNQGGLVTGEKTFENDVTIHGHVTSGSINGLDLTRLNWLRTENVNYQSVAGRKTFKDNVIIENMDVKYINGISMKEFFDNVVMRTENVTISGDVKFLENVTVEKQLNVHGNITLKSGINGIDITNLNENSMKTHSHQRLSGKTFTGKVYLSDLDVNGTINGIVPEDHLMTKNTRQKVYGHKSFQTVYFADDVELDYINGINLTELTRNTLLINSPVTQHVEGFNKFTANVTIHVLNANGKVDGLEIKPGLYVTLHTDQSLEGHVEFLRNLHCEQLTVQGLISGVNISTLNEEAVRHFDDTTIQGVIVLHQDVFAKKNVNITGLVNGIDVSTYFKASPSVDQPYLDSLDQSLHTKFNLQCESLTYIKDSLSNVGYYFDYIDFYQQLHSGHVIDVNYFTFRNLHFVGVVSKETNTNTSCTKTEIFKFDETKNVFLTYQTLAVTSAVKIEFVATELEFFIVLMKKEQICELQSGLLELLRWNDIIEKFEFNSAFPLQEMATDFVVSKELQTNYIFVTSETDNVKVLVNFGLGWTQASTEASPLKSAHLFYADNSRYIAGVYNPDPDSSAGHVKIFTSVLLGMTLVQTINMVAPSHVTTYDSSHGKYLFVTNEYVFASYERSTYEGTLDIYKFSATEIRFVWFQSIPTYRACHVTAFEVGEHFYIMITEKGLKVKIYQSKVDLGFAFHEELAINGVTGTDAFKMNGTNYIVTYTERTEDEHADSTIYKIQMKGVNPDNAKSVNSCKAST